MSIDNGEIASRFEVLRRILDRAENYFLEKEDHSGIDLVEHFRTELRYLEQAVEKDLCYHG